MSKNQLSEVIQAATRAIVANTEEFIKSVEGKPLGSDTIKVMLNGVETVLNREDYEVMKAQNEALKSEMKARMKEVIAQLKAGPVATGPTGE